MSKTVHDDNSPVLPAIQSKRYFTISEVSKLSGVKTHVLRFWEHEFSQLRPIKRRGNRRYYQHHEVLLIHRIRELLYEKGFTLNGARNQLKEDAESKPKTAPEFGAHFFSACEISELRKELIAIQELLAVPEIISFN